MMMIHSTPNSPTRKSFQMIQMIYSPMMTHWILMTLNSLKIPNFQTMMILMIYSPMTIRWILTTLSLLTTRSNQMNLNYLMTLN
jgi:hypothetical protein